MYFEDKEEYKGTMIVLVCIDLLFLGIVGYLFGKLWIEPVVIEGFFERTENLLLLALVELIFFVVLTFKTLTNN